MSFIRTVLGDIPSQELGVCYAHEHIVIKRSYVTEKHPEFLHEDIARIRTELQEFYSFGGRAMVDSMPCGGGRDVLALSTLSRQTGVHIVCPTGVHLAQYYPEGHWSERADVDLLSRIFIGEIKDGIDEYDTNGPALKRTSHHAGVIKIASGLNEIGIREQRIFEAAAIAHCETGSPILTHTEQGTAALAQIDMLSHLGVNLSHLTISHLDRKPDVGYHREVLATGVSLEYDSAFRWKSEDNPTLNLLIQLAADGYLDQLMVGMDAARFRYWKSFGGFPGLTFLLDSFSRKLRSAGFSEQHLATLFVLNPARTFSFSD